MPYLASKTCNNLVICCPDTEVLVLLLHHRDSITARNIYFHTGRMEKHADQTRFIPVHELFEQLTPQQHAILMPIYCLTVCDTVSSAHFMGMARGWHSVFQCRRVSIITKHCQPLETTPFQRENSCNPLCR